MQRAALERRRRRESFDPQERRRYVLSTLERPRTQAELRDALGMSNSGILHLLRRLERDGLVRPAERVAWTRVWEKRRNGD
ncbi:winged helix-turn-helix transcriptional regulator [Primorskyibacter flagellatus]|uniref:winged helix-turn-helix transcriptional regulator n=1 Tax=Primorskyibacter flagellatus TaxID=1387277 RepID=UPI003A8CA69F